jgi:hypothetical protein
MYIKRTAWFDFKSRCSFLLQKTEYGFFGEPVYRFTEQYGNQENSDGAQECVRDAPEGAGKQRTVHKDTKHNILQRIVENIDIEHAAHEYLPPIALSYFPEDLIADRCHRKRQGGTYETRGNSV